MPNAAPSHRLSSHPQEVQEDHLSKIARDELVHRARPFSHRHQLRHHPGWNQPLCTGQSRERLQPQPRGWRRSLFVTTLPNLDEFPTRRLHGSLYGLGPCERNAGNGRSKPSQRTTKSCCRVLAHCRRNLRPGPSSRLRSSSPGDNRISGDDFLKWQSPPL